jgi:hypothetical protein
MLATSPATTAAARMSDDIAAAGGLMVMSPRIPTPMAVRSRRDVVSAVLERADRNASESSGPVSAASATRSRWTPRRETTPPTTAMAMSPTKAVTIHGSWPQLVAIIHIPDASVVSIAIGPSRMGSASERIDARASAGVSAKRSLCSETASMPMATKTATPPRTWTKMTSGYGIMMSSPWRSWRSGRHCSMRANVVAARIIGGWANTAANAQLGCAMRGQRR